MFCRASIRQRSRSQLSNLMPGSTVPVTGQVGGQDYFGSQGEKSKVCMQVINVGVCVTFYTQ